MVLVALVAAAVSCAPLAVWTHACMSVKRALLKRARRKSEKIGRLSVMKPYSARTCNPAAGGGRSCPSNHTFPQSRERPRRASSRSAVRFRGEQGV
eukprot:392672-Pleurochrysis_carterae.AAC.1